MKSKSQSLAKALILLSTGIAAASGYWAFNAYQENTRLKISIERAQGEVQAGKEHLADLSSRIRPDADPAREISDVVSKVSLGLYNAQTPYSFSISSLTPKRQAGGATAAAVVDLSDQVPGTKVRSMQIELRGTFERLDGFRAFLVDIQQRYPVSIHSLKIENNQFDISLLVMGV